jgi:hypothetical protein
MFRLWTPCCKAHVEKDTSEEDAKISAISDAPAPVTLRPRSDQEAPRRTGSGTAASLASRAQGPQSRAGGAALPRPGGPSPPVGGAPIIVEREALNAAQQGCLVGTMIAILHHRQGKKPNARRRDAFKQVHAMCDDEKVGRGARKELCAHSVASRMMLADHAR